MSEAAATEGSAGATYKYAQIVEQTTDDPTNAVPAGKRSIEFGKGADPDYEVFTEDGLKTITHETVTVVEAPERLSKEAFSEYIDEEVDALDEVEQ